MMDARVAVQSSFIRQVQIATEAAELILAKLLLTDTLCFSCPSLHARVEQEINPKQLAEEDCRVCDACIQVIDEKLALGVSRRFGKGMAVALAANVSDSHKSHDVAAPLEPDKGGNRTMMTMGRYRYVHTATDCQRGSLSAT